MRTILVFLSVLPLLSNAQMPQPAESDSSYFFLKDNLKNLQNTELMLLNDIESPAGRHLTFIQQYKGIPIFNSQVKLNLGKNGKQRSLFDNTYTVKYELSKEFPETAIISRYLESIEDLKEQETEYVYFPFADSANRELIFIPAAALRTASGDHDNYETVIGAGGQILYSQNLSRYLIGDSLVTAAVFNPDPLTSAGVTYGGLYKDNDDADLKGLNAERFGIYMDVNFNNDTFRLISPYVEIAELSAPYVPPVTSINASFIFTRNQSGFEEVNTYYHINRYQQYIQSLGFTNLVNAPIKVDVHALNGADQSQYNPGIPGSLLFGDGGVDDAEDAETVIHEYGHAIAAAAAPNTWIGYERRAIEEGFGDYLAVSYTRAVNPYKWENVFSWDGHNEFWPGRIINSATLYTDIPLGDIHIAGQIWSSTIMQIWEDIGKQSADQILLQSMYSYSTNMTMTDAAYLFLDADSLLNNGKNYYASYKRFAERKILPPIPFGAYNVTAVNISCSGDCNGIAFVSAQGGREPYVYQWDDLLMQANDTATGLCAGIYNVTVVDSAGFGNTVYATVIIGSITALSASIASTNEDCSICNNGALAAITGGGVPPYSYLWNDPSSQSDSVAVLLDSGTYNVTITDMNGCQIISAGAVGTNSQVALAVYITSFKNLKCNNECSGWALAVASEGTPPYTYKWNDSASQAASVATGLCSGTYIITATDFAGATALDTVIITEPVKLTGKLLSTADFGNANGTAYLSADGGSKPYTYLWDSQAGAQTDSIATGLISGMYSAMLTDANGCNFYDSVEVKITQLYILSISAKDVSCFEECNGEASVTAASGVGSYTYSWGGIPDQAFSTITGLCGGSYTVTVSDSAGEQETATITVLEPNELTGSVTALHIPGCTTESLAGYATGGSPPYSYQWNDPAIQFNDTATGLVAGSYMVTITDQNNCELILSKTISTVTLEAFPNPTQGVIIINMLSADAENATVRIYSSAGKLLIDLTESNLLKSNNCSIDLSEMASGVYVLEIKTNEQISRKKIVKF